jgi:quinol monooxygenase YgiN
MVGAAIGPSLVAGVLSIGAGIRFVLPVRVGAPPRGGLRRWSRSEPWRFVMVRVGLSVRLHARPGMESEVAAFLAGALSAAQAETQTPVWFALRLGPRDFGIFDAFADDGGRRAHLSGPIASALMARASELFDQPPAIEQVDVLAAKVT